MIYIQETIQVSIMAKYQQVIRAITWFRETVMNMKSGQRYSADHSIIKLYMK